MHHPTRQIQNALEQLVQTYKTKEDEFQRFQKDFNIQVSRRVVCTGLERFGIADGENDHLRSHVDNFVGLQVVQQR
jgi:hypothetical protein